MSDFPKKKSVDFEPLAGVIARTLRTCRRVPDIELTRIWEYWDGIVGAQVAGNAQPAAFKGRLLIVHVSSSVWLQQLQFDKADIIRQMNAVFGKPLVCDIKFKIGALE